MPRRSPLRSVRATRRGIRLKQATRACGLATIAGPRCLEDSLPQSLYLPLVIQPVDPVSIDRGPGRSPAEDPLGRSPYRRLTCPSVPAALANHSSKAHLPKWARFRARAHRPVSGQLYEPTSGGLADLVRFPVAFRPPALAFWASCTRRELGPSLPPAYRHTTSARRIPTGLPRSTRTRPDRGGCPLDPGTAVFTRPVRSPRPAPAASQRPVLPPGYHIPSPRTT